MVQISKLNQQLPCPVNAASATLRQHFIYDTIIWALIMNYKLIFWVASLALFSCKAVAVDYLLGNGDVIEINVIQQPDLSLTKTLNDNGEIRFPYVGIVSLQGLTEFAAESLLEDKLDQTNYVVSPQVTIRVIEHHSRVVSVEGLVAKPGEYPIIGATTVEQIVARAGGLLEGADTDVTFFRPGQAPKTIDLYGIYDAGSSNRETVVSTGDRILVSSSPVFYTYGEVERPGRYELEEGMTVYQALSISAGLTDEGSEKNITVIRDSSNDPVTVSLTDKILPNDVIKVRKSLF